jgi:hypothetical protein
MNTSAAIAAALLFASGPATAAELKIVDIKAFLYFEHAGKLSDNIVGAPPFENVAKGGGADHDPATAILFDLTFAGDRRAGSVLDQEDFVLNSVGAEDEIREGLCVTIWPVRLDWVTPTVAVAYLGDAFWSLYANKKTPVRRANRGWICTTGLFSRGGRQRA